MSEVPLFRKIMIANRGEIALRILRACHDLGVDAVVAYSDADRDTLPVRLANEAICIGPAQASRSYNNIPAIISAALITGCDAIHPGYGFLAENPYLPEVCEQVGVTFIGPRAEVIELLGNKAQARALMQKAGVPIVPGSDGPIENLGAARQVARQIGYPLLIKAVAGGGGRGMRVARDEADLVRQLPMAQAEAEAAFANSEVYLEHFVERPRHVEVQILADHFGTILPIGERDCSLQRRHQKLIEEAPAPLLDRKIRDNLFRASIKGAKAAGYTNAGTLEFLVDAAGRFYFMEMNTRIQVEHPITEITTGIDLVAWQIRIAAGQRLTLTERDCQPRGHAIECRITAEDAWRDFSPNVGAIETYIAPGGPWVRVDSHLYPGYRIPPFYDSLLGKIIVWGDDRAQAITRMERALAETVITGVAQTASFLETVIGTDDFRAGEYDTEWLARNQEMLHTRRPGTDAEVEDVASRSTPIGASPGTAD